MNYVLVDHVKVQNARLYVNHADHVLVARKSVVLIYIVNVMFASEVLYVC